MFNFKLISIILLLTSTLACSTTSVTEYATEKPKLNLSEFFNGDIDAYGIFTNRSGKVVKRFHVLIKASWSGKTGTLDESFTYSDGTLGKRVWTLKEKSDGTYTGTASDVIGEAHGEVAGNAFFWEYILNLDVDGTQYKVHFDDWMYLMNDKVMLNKSKMTKWGINLGEVTLTFVKR